MKIIRGTTPTFQFTFKTIDVNNITTAYLSLKQSNGLLIEKDSPTIADNKLSWTLTQEETLSMNPDNNGILVCDWKTTDGTRGRSEAIKFDVEDTIKDEVI